MRKVLVIGVSCAGKTTFGARLAANLGLKFYDLDDLYWYILFRFSFLTIFLLDTSVK